MAGEIGMKQPEFLPEIVPALISVLKDKSPPVARQAIASGINLFRCTFEKIALQVGSRAGYIMTLFASLNMEKDSCHVS